MPEIISEKEYSHAHWIDRAGRVTAEVAPKQGPVIRRQYADGSHDIIQKNTGKILASRGT